MDNLTKGALGATMLLMLGAVGYGVVKIGQMQSENSAIKEQLASERQEREDDKTAEMERRLAEAEKRSAEAEKRQSDAIEQQLAELRAQMKMREDTLAAEMRILDAEREQLTETIATTVGNGGAGATGELNELQKKIRDAASIGQIAQVNDELGFVVVGAGSANGVQPEQRYNVRRDVFIVGVVEISTVEDEGHSVANIVPGTTQPGLGLRAGDELISHPIF